MEGFFPSLPQHQTQLPFPLITTEEMLGFQCLPTTRGSSSGGTAKGMER